jgi:hypothetical protein
MAAGGFFFLAVFFFHPGVNNMHHAVVISLRYKAQGTSGTQRYFFPPHGQCPDCPTGLLLPLGPADLEAGNRQVRLSHFTEPPTPMTSAPPFEALGAWEDALGSSVELIRRGGGIVCAVVCCP